MDRRKFFKNASSLGAGLLAASSGFPISSYKVDKPVRLGVVGVGSRGTGMLKVALSTGLVEVTAVCDIIEERVERAQNLVVEAGQIKPQGYSNGPEDYKRLVEQENLDAVFTATPWELHTPVMVATMKAGKYGGTEMPACVTVEEAWELVETSEKTGMPCMLMENYCYMRDNQMILNMADKGMFGKVNHCLVGYQHDARYAAFSSKGELEWRAYDKLNHDGNRYPTHAIGPAAQWTNINRGNKFDYLVSMSSRSLGMNHLAREAFGPDSPGANLDFEAGDVNTTLIKARNGITYTLFYNVHSPMPVTHQRGIQGTKGIHSATFGKIYFEDLSPSHQWEDQEKYFDEYDHPNWKKHGDKARSSGHGGSDYLCMLDFITAVKNGTQTPIDVYDAATWSAIVELTETSVNNKSQAVDFPDFTRGKWTNRKPLPIEAI